MTVAEQLLHPSLYIDMLDAGEQTWLGATPQRVPDIRGRSWIDDIDP